MKFRYAHVTSHPNSEYIAAQLKAEEISISAYNKNIHIGPFILRTQLITTLLMALYKVIVTKKQNGIVYLTCGLMGSLFPILMRKLKFEKNKINVRFNDPTFYYYPQRGRFVKFLYTKMLNEVDKIIAVSEMMVDDAPKKFRHKLTHSIPPNWRGHAYFKKIKPGDKNFIFVGSFVPNKAIDTLAKVMKIVNKELGTKIYLLGEGIEENLKKLDLDDPSFVYTGHANPIKYSEKALYHVHLARYEPSGTAIIESMASGLIPFVSDRTGNKFYVKQLGPEFVISEKNPEKIAQHMLKMIRGFSAKKISDLSDRARKIVVECDRENAARDFIKKMIL